MKVVVGETSFPDVKYYPYNKPNNHSFNILAKSNHPPSIVKQLPKMVNKKSQIYPVMKIHLIVQK